MRALFVPASGQPASLTDLPVPTPGAGEVQVRVQAAGLNPSDNHIAAGALEQIMEHRYPLVLGRDVAGVVEAVGDGVRGVAVGEEVAAAALPLVAGAARALVDGVDPQPGDVVLINGASGGVGRIAVQLLAQLGVTVVATASPATADRMRELGANDVVDYTAGPVAEQVRALHPDGVDALINLNGWVLEQVPIGAVRSGGVVRTVTQVPDDATLAAHGLTGGQVMASPTGSILAPLAEQAASGLLQVDVFRVLPLGQAQAGLAEIEAGNVHGKIVVDLSL